MRWKKGVLVTDAPDVLYFEDTNGDYLPDDAAYDQVRYEIVTTRVKRGCAEDAIVNGFLEIRTVIRPTVESATASHAATETNSFEGT
jgi:hypothetical protein